MLLNFQSRESIMEQIQKEGFLYYLIYQEDQPIGYFSIMPKVAGKELFLSKIYILAEYRGQGLGQQALHYMESLAQKNGMTQFTLSVNKNNKKGGNPNKTQRIV